MGGMGAARGTLDLRALSWFPATEAAAAAGSPAHSWNSWKYPKQRHGQQTQHPSLREGFHCLSQLDSPRLHGSEAAGAPDIYFQKNLCPRKLPEKEGLVLFFPLRLHRAAHQAGGHSLWLTLLSPLCSFECFIPARFILFQLGLFECFIPVLLQFGFTPERGAEAGCVTAIVTAPPPASRPCSLTPHTVHFGQERHRTPRLAGLSSQTELPGLSGTSEQPRPHGACAGAAEPPSPAWCGAGVVGVR